MTKDRIDFNFLNLGSYTFVQCALLFIYYGLHYNLPIWVLWFPSIITISIIIFILIFMLVTIIIGAINS